MGTVVGIWRLKLIIFLFIILTSIYVSYGMFSDIEIEQYDYTQAEQTPIEYNSTGEGEQQSDDLVSILFGIGDYLTFGSIENAYARIIINLFTTICWITVGYLIFTFVKEWIPFV